MSCGPDPTTISDPRTTLLTRLWADLDAGIPSASVAAAIGNGASVPLAARTDVAALAWASVAAASAAAAELAGTATIALDPDRIAVAFSSERHFRLDGAPMHPWAPLSGFFRSSDGWVRTHGNYPHHAAALRAGLGLGVDADSDAVAMALKGLPAGVATQAITTKGGLCVGVSHENALVDAELRDAPLVEVTPLAASAPRSRTWGPRAAPLHGLRVLDLTRVIAGPVATRTLALLGADVLRIDPPALAEPEWQHLDSGHGKRSALLDLTVGSDRDVFERLLRTADVVITGYRAAALERMGLSPAALASRHPGLIVGRLTAWGATGAAGDRRGFDSIVQAASGIAWIESSDGSRPGALPAQALDHSAGYLLAAAVLMTLRRQAEEGGSWGVDVSLRRVAAELLGMPRTGSPQPTCPAPDAAAHVQQFDIAGRELLTALPAIGYEGGPQYFAPPRPWGRDAAEWTED